jgi:GTPase SAR1 family protein
MLNFFVIFLVLVTAYTLGITINLWHKIRTMPSHNAKIPRVILADRSDIFDERLDTEKYRKFMKENSGFCKMMCLNKRKVKYYGL